MSKIYFLQIMCDFENKVHYENVFSKKDIALQKGTVELEKLFRGEYEKMFEDDNNDVNQKLTRNQLFTLQALYDFTITEFNPEHVDSFNNIEKLPVVKDFDIHDFYSAELSPVQIKHSYDYNGKEIYISAIYLFNYNGKRIKREIMMDYEDYINPNAGTRFKVGDIVKIKGSIKSHYNYEFYNKLHVITDIPRKKKNQKFFRNTYHVIVNHNSYDEGCHVDIFGENELEIYTGELPKDSPLMFLSKYLRGEIKLDNISWMDIECGHITLNENKSFRDIPEIMEQLIGGKRR